MSCQLVAPLKSIDVELMSFVGLNVLILLGRPKQGYVVFRTTSKKGASRVPPNHVNIVLVAPPHSLGLILL